MARRPSVLTVRIFCSSSPVFSGTAILLVPRAGLRFRCAADARCVCRELIDRITILELKMRRLPRACRHSLQRELKRARALRRRAISPSPRLRELTQALRVVNRRLWDVEEELRVCERAARFDRRFIELARTVYQANDRRAALKRRLDELLESGSRDFAPAEAAPPTAQHAPALETAEAVHSFPHQGWRRAGRQAHDQGLIVGRTEARALRSSGCSTHQPGTPSRRPARSRIGTRRARRKGAVKLPWTYSPSLTKWGESRARSPFARKRPRRRPSSASMVNSVRIFGRP